MAKRDHKSFYGTDTDNCFPVKLPLGPLTDPSLVWVGYSRNGFTRDSVTFPQANPQLFQ